MLGILSVAVLNSVQLKHSASCFQHDLILLHVSSNVVIASYAAHVQSHTIFGTHAILIG